MKTYLVTELTSKVKETPDGVTIDGVLFKGVFLADLMHYVGMSDTMLDAVNRFCRVLPEHEQTKVMVSWGKGDEE